MEENLNIELPKEKVYKENPTIGNILSVLKNTENSLAIDYTKENEFGKPEKHIFRTREKKEIRRYIKFYEDSNALKNFINLSSLAQKLAVYAIEKTTKGTTHFYFISGEFCEKYHISNTNVGRAMNELLEKQWLFKSDKPKKYWINMSFFFRGSVEQIYYKYHTDKREFL